MATTSVPGFGGRIVTGADGDYDELRRIWNALHDRRPALICLCESAQDVGAALRFARAEGLPIAVRGGGHSLPGLSTIDDGLVVDLRRLNHVVVDPVARRARVGGGALLGDVDTAAQQHGMVVPAGVISHTGAGGLTVGGGVGRNMRRLGLTVDSLVSAEVVTADGRIVRASETEHPDLFWAIRGGGGNFGVVTEFEYVTHDQPDVVVLAMYHLLDVAPAMLAHAERTMQDAPDELLWTSFVRKAPPAPWMADRHDHAPRVSTLVEWSGDREEGLALLEKIRADVAPTESMLEVLPYLTLQTMGDEVFRHGLLSYIKATFAAELSDGLVATLLDRAASLGSDLTQVELLSMGGAIARVPSDATAFAYRDARWLVNVPASWLTPEETASEVAWVRETFAAVQPYVTGGSYVNFMDADEVDEESTAYGPTVQRLREVKATYDPTNIFRRNQNIAPVSA